MLIIEMAKIESTGGHIGIMLFIEITKIKLTGGHIEFMQITRDGQNRINRRPYWNLTGWPYWIYANYRDGQNRILTNYIDWIEMLIMLIIEMAKIEINRRPYWIYANYRDGQRN